MTVNVSAPGAAALADDLDAAANALADLDQVEREIASHIAGNAAANAPRLTGALAAGTRAEGAAVAVTGIAASYVQFVRFGTSRTAGRDYITDAIRPDQITAITNRHIETATETLEKNYG